MKGQFTITPEQEKALREEAFKRAMAVGSGKPDASEVLREVLEEWLKNRGKYQQLLGVGESAGGASYQEPPFP